MISNIKEFNTTSGNVVVNVKDYNLLRETITTHNSSTVLLCRFLRDALIGANIVDLIPDRIVPFKMDEDKFNNQEQHIEQNTTNLIDYGIQASGRVNDGNADNTKASATLSFLIPNSLLQSGTVIHGFKLYSGKLSNEKMYAIVFLNNPITVVQGTSLEVSWTLVVSPK